MKYKQYIIALLNTKVKNIVSVLAVKQIIKVCGKTCLDLEEGQNHLLALNEGINKKKMTTFSGKWRIRKDTPDITVHCL